MCIRDRGDDRLTVLLHALRAGLEERGDHRLTVRCSLNPEGGPAHAPSASFIFDQNPLPRACEGGVADSVASCRISSSSSRETVSGVQSCTRTCRSPAPLPFTRGKPRPRRCNTWP